MKKLSAFTLAEVLITLAIIGVVAAMTLPTLIQKHQKKVWATKFQQSLSVLSQGFQKAMADEGVTDFYETDLGRAQHWDKSLLEKYFKIASTLDTPSDYSDKINEIQQKISEDPDKYNWEQYGWDENIIAQELDNLGFSYGLRYITEYTQFDPVMLVLQNGLTIAGIEKVEYHDDSFNIESIFIIIDTNGASKPNLSGYDRFGVVILDTGLVVPYNSKVFANHTVNKILPMAKDFCIKDGQANNLEVCVFAVGENGIRDAYNDRPNLGDVDALYAILDIFQHNNGYYDHEIKDRCKIGYYNFMVKFACSGYLYDNNFVMDY